MALRFRKSIKLAPGIRMNLSGGGLSWSLGPRGSSISIGKRGTFLNSSIPGTGLYSRQRLGVSKTDSRRDSLDKNRGSTRVNVPVTVGVEDDGTIHFQDGNGNPLQEHVITAAKRQQGDKIRGLIKTKCEEINAQVEALGEIHLYTPSPDKRPQFRPDEFDKAEPVRPPP